MSTIREVRVSVIRDGKKVESDKAMDCPDRSAKAAREIIGHDEREHLIVFLLDARSQVKHFQVVSIGTLSASLVHPREVFRPAVVWGAAGIIVVHNHPSGDTSPSPDDRETTRRLARAGELLGIPLLDHIIIADGKTDFFSFKTAGVLI
jgi:DNA repair protein RadC